MMKFCKYEASGNDFLVVELPGEAAGMSLASMAERMCDRHYGAGADGLLVINARASGDRAPFQMRVMNQDGSEAQMSGNGIRCVAAHLYYSGRWRESEVSIGTKAGPRRLRRMEERGRALYFEVEMGPPKLSSNEIPLALRPARPRVIRYPLRVGEEVYHMTACSMGNPHCCIILPDLDLINVAEVGAQIEGLAIFPERTNVEFIEVLSRSRIRVLYWERGVGETLSSGTGSCAAAVAAMLNGLVNRSVQVLTRAGELSVHWREDDVVTLTGPVKVVYRGEWLAEGP